jgi:hypothetical protein
MDKDQWRTLMKFWNRSAIVSVSEIQLHSDVLQEGCLSLADLHYASAVA